jgi:hypothetical protein
VAFLVEGWTTRAEEWINKKPSRRRWNEFRNIACEHHSRTFQAVRHRSHIHSIFIWKSFLSSHRLIIRAAAGNEKCLERTASWAHWMEAFRYIDTAYRWSQNWLQNLCGGKSLDECICKPRWALIQFDLVTDFEFQQIANVLRGIKIELNSVIRNHWNVNSNDLFYPILLIYSYSFPGF